MADAAAAAAEGLGAAGDVAPSLRGDALCAVALCGAGAEAEALLLCRFGLVGAPERAPALYNSMLCPAVDALRQSLLLSGRGAEEVGLPPAAAQKLSRGGAAAPRPLSALPRPGESLLPLPLHWALLPLASAAGAAGGGAEVGRAALSTALRAVAAWRGGACGGASYLARLPDGMLLYHLMAAALFPDGVLDGAEGPAEELLRQLAAAAAERAGDAAMGEGLAQAATRCEQKGRVLEDALLCLAKDLCAAIAQPPGAGGGAAAPSEAAQACRAGAIYVLMDERVRADVRLAVWGALGVGGDGGRAAGVGPGRLMRTAEVGAPDGTGLLHLLRPLGDAPRALVEGVAAGLRLMPAGGGAAPAPEVLDAYVAALMSPHAAWQGPQAPLEAPFSIAAAHVREHLFGGAGPFTWAMRKRLRAVLGTRAAAQVCFSDGTSMLSGAAGEERRRLIEDALSIGDDDMIGSA